MNNKSKGQVDYTKEKRCSLCQTKQPIELMRCPDCNQKLRSKPHNQKNRKVKRN
jgi:uncharacterized protein with PIN domain